MIVKVYKRGYQIYWISLQSLGKETQQVILIEKQGIIRWHDWQVFLMVRHIPMYNKYVHVQLS